MDANKNRLFFIEAWAKGCDAISFYFSLISMSTRYIPYISPNATSNGG